MMNQLSCGHTTIRSLFDSSLLSNIHSSILSNCQSSASGKVPLSGLSKDQTPYSLTSFNSLLHPLVYDASLLAIIKNLFATESVIPIQIGILTKAAGAPPTPWHRDRDHLPISTNVLSAWIPLTPIDKAQAIIYAEGTTSVSPEFTQTTPSRSFAKLKSEYFEPYSKPESLNPGDVDIHDGHTWHMAPENNTNHARVAIGIAYVPSGCRIDMSPKGFDSLSGLKVRLNILANNFTGLSDGDLIPEDPLT